MAAGVNRQTVCSLRNMFHAWHSNQQHQIPLFQFDEQMALPMMYAGMLREGDYGAFYRRACQRAAADSPPGLRPLEFTHVMIDEAGQASLSPAMHALLFVLCYEFAMLRSRQHPNTHQAKHG